MSANSAFAIATSRATSGGSSAVVVSGSTLPGLLEQIEQNLHHLLIRGVRLRVGCCSWITVLLFRHVALHLSISRKRAANGPNVSSPAGVARSGDRHSLALHRTSAAMAVAAIVPTCRGPPHSLFLFPAKGVSSDYDRCFRVVTFNSSTKQWTSGDTLGEASLREKPVQYTLVADRSTRFVSTCWRRVTPPTAWDLRGSCAMRKLASPSR